MILSWNPLQGALTVTGSRRTAIDTMWRQVPEADRTPARRRLVIALVDHIREYHERTGHLAPSDVKADVRVVDDLDLPPGPVSPVADPRPPVLFTDAQQRLLDEHQGDTCEHEMSSCSDGCPVSYCTSEAHMGKVAPDWPCRVAAPILGYRNAAAYWRAQEEAWFTWHGAGESRG